MAGIAAAVGVGSSLFQMGSSLFGGDEGGGGGGMPAPPPSWMPPNLDATANTALGGIGGLSSYNIAGPWVPWANQSVAQLYNNPYRGQFQDRTDQAANIGWGTGQGQVNAGNTLMQGGMNLLPWADQILQQGFDPQNALRDRTANNVEQATRAGLQARGINTTPYGAGVEGKAMSDFNIDWENNLLNRMNTAGQGAGYLTNSAGNAINLGQNVGTLGLETLGRSAAAPFNAFNTIGNSQLGAISAGGAFGNQAAQIPQMQIGDWLQYLQLGNQAGGVANTAYGNALSANNQRFNQNQTLGSNFGSSIQGLGRAFGSGGGSSGWGSSLPSFLTGGGFGYGTPV